MAGQGFLGGVRGVGLHPRRLSPQGQLWCLILINRGKAQPGSHQTPMAVVWWVMRVSKRNTQPNGMVGWTDRLVHCMLNCSKQFWCTCCYMCVYNHVHCKGSTHYIYSRLHGRSHNVVRGVKSTASVSFVRACVYKAENYTAH